MTWLELINEVGNEDLIRLYLQGKVKESDLLQEMSSSSLDLVNRYRNQRKEN